jgi:ABC-type antimicrobial peptide transport system permease subunit
MKDEEFRLVIEPLEKVTRIMLILLPFIIIVTSLIIGAISVYMVFQRSFEAALMRALGATKLHTVLRQSLEQMLLCLIGLIIGLLILQVYHKTQLMQFTDVILITFVLYFITTTLSSMFASGYAISQRVLELLQAKE